ncbi:Lysine-specific demethylase 3B [Coemansia sp. IMI 209127]|nr:Lysine-specific demethylase 3B [Coemansia sp. IMI 209127]
MSEAPIADAQIPEVQMSEEQMPDVQTTEVHVPNAQVPEVQVTELHVPNAQMSDVQDTEMHVPNAQVPEVQDTELHVPNAQMSDVQDTEMHVPNAQVPEVQDTEVQVPNPQVPEVRTPETRIAEVQIPNADTLGADVPNVLVPDVQMSKPPIEADIDPHSSPRMSLDEPRLDSMFASVDSSDIADEELGPITLSSPKTDVSYISDDPLDSICMQLPDPETVCSPDFDHRYLKSNAFEPAHTLVTARKERTHVQAIFEYQSGSFPISEDPSLWLYFQRQKYERWTALYPTCKRVKIQLIPQVSGCLNVNHLGQPQCRQCIKRGAGIACGFASVRYITLLTIELVDGTVAKRYLVCPIFRSEIEKAPAMRQPITPIVLPGRYVVENDNSWLEFHILCMTSSSIKSLLRRELAIVRDVQVSEARGFSRGTISFHDSAMAPQAVVNDNDNVVHPIYACSPSPCILRKARVDKTRNCYRCTAPIFSAHFACCVCMEMICVECFVDWDDVDVTEHFYIREKGAKGKAAAGRADNSVDSVAEISHCKRFLQTEADKPVFYSTRHRKSQFIRVSHFTEEELEMMLCKTNRIVQYCDLLDETQPAGYSAISLCSNVLRLDDPEKTVDYSWTSSRLDKIDMDTQIIAKLGDADFGADLSLRPSSLDNYWPRMCDAVAGPSRSQSQLLEAEWDEKLGTHFVQQQVNIYPWQTTPLYVSAGQLTLREFARLWEESRVIVVEGLMSDLENSVYSAEHLVQALGKLLVPVCKASTRQHLNESWTLEQFLGLFSKGIAETQPDVKDGKWTERKEKLENAPLRASIKVRDVVDALEQRIGDSADTNGAGAASTTPKKRRVNTVSKKKNASKAVATATSNNITSHDGDDIQKHDHELVRHLKALEESFESILPFKEYTSPTGQLNLVNRLPDQYKKPSIGPEIHCEYGQTLSGSHENMRCEGFDMVNVVLSASSADDMLSSTSRKNDAIDAPRLKPRGRQRRAKGYLEEEVEVHNPTQLEQQRVVEWDIFPPSSLDLLRNYLSEGAEEYELKQSAIHSQDVYLDENQRRELFRRGGDDSRSCIVYQRPGDAVFVPSGSMYQRRVFRNTVCLQSGFVSPEGMVSTRQLSNEIAGLRGHSRRNNALPVMDILWWTWMGNETDRKKSADEIVKVSKSGAPKQSIADKGSDGRSSKKPSAKRRR